MIVLVLTQEYPPYLLGGLATHVQHLARGLVARGHIVHVVSYSMERTFSVDDRGVQVHFLKFPFPGRSDQYQGDLDDLESASCELAEFAAQKLAGGRAPELIHAHEWMGFLCGERLRRRFKAPLVVTSHMVWAELLEKLTPHPLAPQIVECERKSCRLAERIIAVSRSLKEEIIARYGVSRVCVDVVWNGFDAGFFHEKRISVSALAEERARLGIRNEKLVVYAGRLSPQKGLAPLLRSAMLVLQRRKDARYVIAGKLDSGYPDLLRAMVQGNPLLDGRVLFLDRISRERLTILYALAKVAVVPSLYEPFGYAATEAMAAGKPVIASHIGGLAEIIEDRKSGFLVPVLHLETGPELDIQKLCEAQLEILDHPDLAARLGAAGRKRVQERFTVEQMVDGTLRAYESTLSDWSNRNKIGVGSAEPCLPVDIGVPSTGPPAPAGQTFSTEANGK